MPNITGPSTEHCSPYLLQGRDVKVLNQSDGFRILRDHLAQTYRYELCINHKPTQSKCLARWILVRDVLHALLVPVVELFDKAVTLAVAAIGATTPEELEYAFTDQARNAFTWLHCFLSNDNEREWCYTRGCPACVAEHSLRSEFSIRMLCAACLLSDVHYPFTLEGPKLPSFRFFLDTLKNALTADPRYGCDYFESMQTKAIALRNGIEDLIHQCVELEDELSTPSSPSDSVSGMDSAISSTQSSPVLGPLGAKPPSEGSGMRLRRGRGRSRQMSLQVEEDSWIEEMLKRCCDQWPPTELREGAPSQALDEMLRKEPTVAVSQVQSAG